MATRLTLLCHAATAAMRAGAFPAMDDTLDEGGRAKAAARRLEDRIDRVLTSPARAAVETAGLLGLDAEIEPALRDLDQGDWAGQAFAAIHRRNEAAFAAWLADPAVGAAGGESLSDGLARIAPWLEMQAPSDLNIVAITHSMIVRAILCATLGIAPPAAMRIDLAPLSTAVLSFNRMWRLQSIGA